MLIKTPHATGQGLFIQDNNECYVVTPAHVIGDERQARLLTADRKEHTAIKHHEFDVDIALLKVTSSPSPCQENHSPVNKLSTVLTVVKNGELNTKLDDGSTLRTPIEIVAIDDTEFLEIKASDTGRPFKQGFSGSVLYIANSISGLLIEVDEGRGYVYRYDALEELLNNFFGVEDNTPSSPSLKPQQLKGSLIRGETNEFTLELHQNSPIEITSHKRTPQMEYLLEIFDADGNRQFKDDFWSTTKYRYAFTPLSDGPHTVRLTGLRNDGNYDIRVEQYALDSTLRGKGNVFVPGDSLKGRLARNSVAEYRFEALSNSPIEITSHKLDTQIEYLLEIFDADGNRQFSDDFWSTTKYRYAFTPLSDGTHTVRLTGLRNHGNYDIRVEQYALDSTLRGRGNVFVPGDNLKGKLARNSVAEYRFEAQTNSPIEITSHKLDTQIEYLLEIFDADGNRQFSDDFWSTTKYRYAFTPLSDGIHTVRLTGLRNHGKYDIQIEQYALDSTLRGAGNVFAPGDSLKGKLARNSVAEYRFEAQANSPVEITSHKLDTQIEYLLEIFDADGNRQFRDDFWSTTKYRYAFTPLSKGPHTVRLTGLRNHGRYDIQVEQYALDSTLRGAGNVFVPGDSLKGKLARNSVAEYRFEAQANSPIEITSHKLTTQIEYLLEIFDAEGNRQFRDDFWSTTQYRYAFTPQTSGTHTIRLTGLRKHGRYQLEVK